MGPALRHLHLPAVVAAAFLAGGCAAQAPGPAGSDAGAAPSPLQQVGDTATWELLHPGRVGPTDQGLMVGVTRLGCSSGVTGQVLPPQVAYGQDRIVVRTDVERLPDGASSCPGNDVVPVEVHLEEPIGGRDLVDAACLEGEAVGTAACPQGPRWSSPARGATAQVPDWSPPPDYSFEVQSTCGERSLIGRYAVRVAAGVVVDLEPLLDGWDGVTPDQAPTLASMLEDARQAVAGGGTAEVAVDGAGVPRWVSVDPVPDGVDDEACYAVSAYRPG